MGTKRSSYTNSCDSDAIKNYIEVCIDPNTLNNFSNEEGLQACLEDRAVSEEFQQLRKDLIEEVMRVIKTCLTPNQLEIVLKYYYEGKTQETIAEELGKHQTTIHKTIKGNIDYENNKRYGGALKKVKAACDKNKKIQDLIKKMGIKKGIKPQEEK